MTRTGKATVRFGCTSLFDASVLFVGLLLLTLEEQFFHFTALLFNLQVLSLRQIRNVMRVNTADLEPQEPIEYRYKKDDLMKAAEMRTSYIGKMRGDKEHPDFIDRMSLTEGESFLSDDMLKEAMVKVHEWLVAFTKGIEEPYGIKTLLDSEEGVQVVFFNLQPKNWWNRAVYGSVENYIKEALIEYIIYKWFEYVNAEEAQAHYDKYEDNAHEAQLGMNAENGTLERRFNTPFNTIFESK
jgi:hypothetical protein